jgi:hypothetical protein
MGWPFVNLCLFAGKNKNKINKLGVAQRIYLVISIG